MFEGKPPELKREELAKRAGRREGATADLEAAKEVGGLGVQGVVDALLACCRARQMLWLSEHPLPGCLFDAWQSLLLGAATLGGMCCLDF